MQTVSQSAKLSMVMRAAGKDVVLTKYENQTKP